MHSVLLTSSVDNSLLISSFLRYVDEFEQDALKSVMNGDINADIDEDVYDNVVAILRRCQSAQLPTREHLSACMQCSHELACMYAYTCTSSH